MKRKELLDAAAACVLTNRANVYGGPEQNFERIAAMWSMKLGITVEANDVAWCLLAVKMTRLIETPTHPDSWVDIAGYAACGAEVSCNLEKDTGGSNED